MANARHVALVDDDKDMRRSTAQVLRLAGFSVETFAGAGAALGAIDADWPGIVVTDVRMPHVSGVELFRTLHERDPGLPVILVTGHGDVAMAVDALKAGAWDFLTKPFDPQALVAAADRASTARTLALDNRRLRAAAQDEEPSGLVGQSEPIRRLRAMILTLANADIDVFIEGETGTGKELFARLVHRAGRRSRHRFVPVACAGLPDALEDALFVPGGEASIASAHRGTVFLDDVDQASRRLQTRLTALLEDRTLRGPGVRDPLPLDLRVIATAGAGEGDAGALIAPGLLYRLTALRLRMPPLRERREDVPALFAHLAGAAALRLRRPLPVITGAIRAHLSNHEWPGNVRELAHFAERVVLDLADAPSAVRGAEPGHAPSESLPEKLDAFERETIIAAVLAEKGDIGAAIARLGVPRKTFYYKTKKHDIDLGTLRKAAK